MALKMTILSRKNAESNLESKRLLLKALPEEDRVGSQEEADFLLAEKIIHHNMYNPLGSDIEAYLKIDRLDVSKNSILITISMYLNEISRREEAQELKTIHIQLPYNPNVEAGDPLANAYNYLKTLDIFSTAIDC